MGTANFQAVEESLNSWKSFLLWPGNKASGWVGILNPYFLSEAWPVDWG